MEISAKDFDSRVNLYEVLFWAKVIGWQHKDFWANFVHCAYLTFVAPHLNIGYDCIR